MAAGAMVVLALLMLGLRRADAAIGAYALQSAGLALAVALQGWAPGAWLFALAILGVQGVLIPYFLRRFAPGAAPGNPAAMTVGVAIVVLAALAARKAALPADMAREDLAAALAVTLLGLLAVVSRRDPLGQILGLLSAASGCALAAVSSPGLPPPMVLLAFAPLGVPALGAMLMARPR